MRLQRAVLACLVALSCAEHIGLRHGLRARQDNAPSTTENSQSSTPVTSTGATSKETPSPTPSPSRTETDDVSQSTNSQDGDPIEAVTTSSVPPSPTSTVVLPGSNSTSEGNTLPIQPKLNPPVGVGGVILIITGLALCLVGIKHKATQTFLSTSLLVALGVEVLIVYLMHPPVSVGVQAAYVVAGVVGGFLLGGLALIFKEMSEGFGCVLGGFCLAMWLLVLSPGGLITNKVGKIILIAMLCAGCYSLYISRFTRVYGLIFCTAFAGSTAFVLGIDCFSNAGLKEFWIYIWDLNDDEFPLFTESYPITKNMRAEIAAIIIVAFIGTMSQIKIWKIVKERKAKRDAQRLEDEEAREAEEAQVGRDVEERNRESLTHWEGTYDGKKGPFVDSQAVSLEDFSSDGTASRKYYESKRFSSVRRQSASSLGHNLLGSDFQRSSAAPSLPSFSFGFEHDEARQAHPETGAATPTTEPPSPGLDIAPSPALERREATVRPLSMMSLHAKEVMDAADKDTPFDSVEEEDLASSIAATGPDAPDMDALSVRLSRPNSLYLSQGGGASPVLPKEQFIDEDDEEALLPVGGASAVLPKSPGTPNIPGKEGDAEEKGAEEQVEKIALETRLPKKISKAALTYRTNEWAKEVSRAEPEPIEEQLEHDSDAVRIEMGNAAESARAEENNAGPELLPPPPPPAPPKPVKARSSANFSRTPSARTPAPIYAHNNRRSRDSWSEPLIKRASSNPVFAVPSEPVPALPLDTSRNISMPMLDQPAMAASPLDAPRPKSRPGSTMAKQANLLDERRERLERRLTTTSFISPNPELETPHSISEASGKAQSSRTPSEGGHTNPSSISIPDNEEDMTLSERKTLVLQQIALQPQNAGNDTWPLNALSNTQTEPSVLRRSQTQTRSSTRPQTSKTVRLSANGSHQPVYDSHQPRRASTHDNRKQAVNWTQWRNSNVMTTTSRDQFVIGDSQMDMLRAARLQSETEAKMREQHKYAMQEQMDAHMRMGGMNDAHRRAMAKMQGQVK